MEMHNLKIPTNMSFYVVLNFNILMDVQQIQGNLAAINNVFFRYYGGANRYQWNFEHSCL